MAELWNTLKPAVRAFLRMLWAVVLTIWSVVRVPVLFVVQVIAALILLFEEWGWKPLSDLLAQFSRFKPWALLERWIAQLPPYGALAAFALPVALLFPLKLVAVWLLANGHYFYASALFIGAKLASTAFIARIFLLTKPSLMRIAWFARAYNFIMPWKNAIFARIRESFAWRYGRMLKNAIRLEVKQAYVRWKPWIAAHWYDFAPRIREALRSVSLNVKTWWLMWKPRAAAELSRWRAATKRAWERLTGIA